MALALPKAGLTKTVVIPGDEMIRGALVLFVVVGLIAYAVAASAIDFDEVIHAIGKMGAGTWIFVLALSLINYKLRFGRWHVYISNLGHRVPVLRHLAIYVAGFALTPTPGKVGEGIRALHLKLYGVGYGRSLSTLYAERLLDVLAVSVLAVLLWAAPVSGFRWLALVGVAIASVLLALQHPVVLAVMERWAARAPRGRWANGLARVTAFQRDVTSLVRTNLFVFGLGIGLVAWAAEGFGLYLVANALGIEIGPWAAIGIYATAMLAGALSFIPGGLGSAEAMMAALLVSAGAPLPAAAAATLLIRLATLWFAVALGAAAWLGIEATRRRPVATPAAGREG